MIERYQTPVLDSSSLSSSKTGHAHYAANVAFKPIDNRLAAVPSQGPEIFDAIVRAADPRHPDHDAWKGLYGSMSKRSPRNSVTGSRRERTKSFSPQTVSNSRSMEKIGASDVGHFPPSPEAHNVERVAVRRKSLDGHAESDADDSLEFKHKQPHHDVQSNLSQSAILEPTLLQGLRPTSRSRSSSLKSASSRGLRRLREKEKGKRKASPSSSSSSPPVPPRLSSSSSFQSSYGHFPGPKSTLSSLSPISGAEQGNFQQTTFSPDFKPSRGVSKNVSPFHSLHHTGKALSARPISPGRALGDQTVPLVQQVTQVPSTTANVAGPLLSSIPPHHSESRNSVTPPSNLPKVPLQPGTSQSTMDQPLTPARNRIKSENRGFFTFHRALFSKSSPRLSELSPPSPSVSFSPPTQHESVVSGRKSFSRLRKAFGNDASSPVIPTSPGQSGLRKGSVQIIRTLAPPFELAHQGTRFSVDVARVQDPRAFSLRSDREFRSNHDKFQDSDDTNDELEQEQVVSTAQGFQPVYFNHTSDSQTRNPRGSGVVRRSLDSIISPFRAGLVSNSSPKQAGKGFPGRSEVNPWSASEQVKSPELKGRRSFSDTRIARVFAPKNRSQRPLSKVSDRPESENEEEVLTHDVDQHLNTKPGAEVDKFKMFSDQGIQKSRTFNVFSSHADSPLSRYTVDSGFHSMPVTPLLTDQDTKNLVGRARSSSGKQIYRVYPNAFEEGCYDADSSASHAHHQSSVRSASNTDGLSSCASDVTNHEIQSGSTTPQQKSKLAGLFNKVRGSLMPGRTPSSASLSSGRFDSPQYNSFSPSFAVERNTHPETSQLSLVGEISTPAGSNADTKSPVGLGFSPEILEERKQDRALRARVKSLGSSGPSRPNVSKSGFIADPEEKMPALSFKPGEPISLKDGVWKRNLLHEAVGLSLGASSQSPSLCGPTDSPKPDWAYPSELPSPLDPTKAADKTSDAGPSPFSKLLRKKKTQEDLDAVIQAFTLTPPRMPAADSADEAKPRPSVSSTRGFILTLPEGEEMMPDGVTPQTIRKTLSPALLSETVDVESINLYRDDQDKQEIHAQTQNGDEDDDDDDNQSFYEANQFLPTPSNAPIITGNELLCHDEVEILKEDEADREQFDGFMGKSIYGKFSIDRIPKFEEFNDRLSVPANPHDIPVGRKSFSAAEPPYSPRSFGEHRTTLRSTSGNVQKGVPPALALGNKTKYQYGKRSMDSLRPYLQTLASHHPPDSQASKAHVSFSSSLKAKSPRKMSFGDGLRPWIAPISASRNNRKTSFSMDRDRAPVASPLSPPKEPRPVALTQALKFLTGKGKSRALRKGIGPNDVIISGFEDVEEELTIEPKQGEAPSAGIRPSFDLHSGVDRRSFVATEMMTKLLEVQAQTLQLTPTTPVFPFHQTGHAIDSENSHTLVYGGTVLGAVSPPENNTGLGLGPISSMRVDEGAEVSFATTLPGVTSATRSKASITPIIYTDEEPSLTPSISQGSTLASHMFSSQDSFHPVGVPYLRQSSHLLKTPNTTAPHTPSLTPKTPDIAAFEDMLGKFGQREKQLMKDIAARAATTAKMSIELGNITSSSHQYHGSFSSSAVSTSFHHGAETDTQDSNGGTGSRNSSPTSLIFMSGHAL